ncbi:PREDICTED: neural/ectodermal development factor IMP-L2-like [Priapulus caudatus]|nr:PREDICTED: neural/ectodermal development factor IMP-L2-like [Priapulus caudatus]
MWTGHHIEVEGGDVRLLCRHSGFPQAKVTWYGPENNLVGHKPSGKYKIMRNGDLVVSHSSWLEDMGEFKCVVSNPYGRDEASTFFYPAMADDSEGF